MLDLRSMNEGQRTAATHGEGPMLVLAGPGSGKTYTITNRISYLIEEERVNPENILVITFTKDAALSMQERFLKQEAERRNELSESSCISKRHPAAAIGVSACVPVNFGTFHAIFYQIIKQSQRSQADRILKDTEKKRLIAPILLNFRNKMEQTAQQATASDISEDASRCLAAISYYKNTGDVQKAAERLNSPWKERFGDILRAYEKARTDGGRLDFDDMVFGCLKLLKDNPELLSVWQKRFRYILIDEFQDINPMQYQVVRLLCARPHNLFAVGDDDQSIYGFRGSQPSLMRRFLEDYPQAKQVLLDVNYRSRPEIVEASLKVISQNKDRFVKELKAHRGSGCAEEGSCCVTLQAFREKEEQYEYLTGRLREEAQKEELTHCAVLFRTNAQMQGCASILTRAGIPYSMKEKSTCLYDHFIARDIRNYVRLAMGEREREIFLAVMNKPSRFLSRDAFTEGTVDFQKVRDYYRVYAPPDRVVSLLAQLERLERGLNQLKGMKPCLGMQFLRRGIGYERYLSERAGTDREKLLEWQEVLDFLCGDAREYGSYEEWFSYQDYFREELEQSGAAARPEDYGVRLMTVHASKGLEFCKVFLPDINEGVYPHGRMTDAVTVEEERRMLYVAMTRAKEALELLFVTGTKERPRLPSRFLNVLL